MGEGRDSDVNVKVSEHDVVQKECLAEPEPVVSDPKAKGGVGEAEDIMVEVSGEEVVVGGVCCKPDGEGGCSSDGLGRDADSSEGRNGAVGDVESRGSMNLSGDGMVEKCNDACAVEGGKTEEVVEKGRDVVGGVIEVAAAGDMGVLEVEGVEARNGGNVIEAAGQMDVFGSTGEGREAIRNEEVDAVEEVGEGWVNDGAMRGQGTVGVDAASGAVSQDAEAFASKVENVSSESLVGEVSLMESDKDLEDYVGERSVDKELGVGKSDDPDDLTPQKAGVFGNEVENHGPGTTAVCASAISQDVNMQSPAIDRGSAMVLNEGVLTPNDHISAGDALDGCTSERSGTSGAEAKCIKVAQDCDGNENNQLFVEQDQVVVAGEVLETTQRHRPCSKVESDEGRVSAGIAQDLMGNDSTTMQKMDVNEQITGVGEASHDQQEKENDKDSKLAIDGIRGESHSGDVILSSPLSQAVSGADVTPMHEVRNPSFSPNGQSIKTEAGSEGKSINTQVADVEVSLMETDETLKTNPDVSGAVAEDQRLMPEEFLDNTDNGDGAHFDSPSQYMELEGQSDTVKQATSCGVEEVKAEGSKVEISGSSESQGSVTADMEPPLHPTQAVEARNNEAILNIIDVPMSIDTDGMALPSESGQKLSTEVGTGSTGEGTEVVTNENPTVLDGQLVLDAAVNVQGSEEVDGQSRSDVLNVNGISQVDSGPVQETGVEKLVNDAEQLSSHEGQELKVEEAANDAVDFHRGQELETEKQVANVKPQEIVEKENAHLVAVKPGSLERVHQAGYLLPPEDEDEFSVSDLVWGKVRSHPWWPGQIFDPSDSSEQAVKYHKKDCFLVAYFGDRTFAWNDASQLKPFRKHFSHIEKQSNSESFHNAVSCALEEVSRRVELGLACSCMPNDDYEKIRFQKVENAGIRQESSIRDGADNFFSADCFQPKNLLGYMKSLSRLPSGGADRLELAIAKAQLLSFYRLQGRHQLPELQFCGELLDSGADHLDTQGTTQLTDVDGQAVTDTKVEKNSGSENVKHQRGSYHRRKHNLTDGVYHGKKERSVSELMSAMEVSPGDEYLSDGKVGDKTVISHSGRKRKPADFLADDPEMQDRRKTISVAKVYQSTPPAPVPSFKIGNRICRVASQLTASPILKSNTDRLQKLEGSSSEPNGDDFDLFLQNAEKAHGEKMKVPGPEYSSFHDLMSQLFLAAQDPLKGRGSLNTITSFFSDFRNFIVPGQTAVEKASGKRKKSSLLAGDPETFEFEDMSDSYWTDRVIENGSEEQPSQRKKKRDYPFAPVEVGKPPQTNRRSSSRKRYSNSSHEVPSEKTTNTVDRKKEDVSPTELVILFPEADRIPSEANLNKTFRSFGSLWESETEIDHDSNRARVIFKRCSDAEVAYSSAGRFNIFGNLAVNYQLNHTPTIPFKALPDVAPEGQEDAI